MTVRRTGVAVELHPQMRNHPVFTNLRPKLNSRVINGAREIVAEACAALEPELPLPRKVFFGFKNSCHSKGGYTFAAAFNRTVILGDDFVSYLLKRNRRSGSSVLLGIIGHELSHVSDYYTNNGCSGGGLFHRVVSEGKAELVGLAIGGDDYRHLDGAFVPLENDERIMSYRALLVSTGLRPRRGARSPASIINDRSPMNQYRVGAHFIGEVVANGSSIFDVHRSPPDYFKDQLSFLTEGIDDAASR